MFANGQDTKNYAELMYLAKQNAAEAKKKAANNFLLPETSKKRVDPKQVKLKEGVAKFLAKREEEERRKKEMERRKKEKLLELRNQDRKATNRVRKMLSMTKSANKSCVDDAKDCLNASVAAQTQGDIQPDEDDYGYTSNFADQMHKKMMEKYKSIPIKPAFPQSRLDVPKAQSLPRSNKNWTSKQDYNPEEGDVSPEYNHEAPQSKKHEKERLSRAPKRPPPPDYAQLLQLAQGNKETPLPVIPIVEKKMEKEEFEFGRPMTKKEKAQYLAEKELRERVARRLNDMRSDKNNNDSNSGSGDKGSSSFKIPKANKQKNEEDRDEYSPKRSKITSSSSSESKSISNGNTKPKSPEATVSSGRYSSQSPPNQSSSSKLSNGLSTSTSQSAKYDRYEREAYSQSSRRSPSPQRYKERDRSQYSKPSGQPIRQDKKQEKIERYRQEREKEKLQREKEERILLEKEERIRLERIKLQKLRIQEEKHERMQQERQERIQQERQERIQQEKEERLKKERLEKMEKLKERPRYLSAFEGKSDRDRNQVKKQSSQYSERSAKPSSSRDMYNEGKSSEKSYKESKLSRRDDMPPPQRRDMHMKPSSRMRDESPPPRMKPKAIKGRAIIDSDEEYDSEMDDFIDDSEVDMGNISAEIGRIFNYDRNRFKYQEESDDECMESSFAQQSLEERRSLRIGIQEDLEDMRREEEELKRKMQKNKKMGRR